jgi:hypothetical protein
MNIYFSGIAGAFEYQMLVSAEVERMLVDPFNHKHIPPGRAGVALDSGACLAFENNLKLDLDWYLNFVRNHGPFDFAVSLDVIGNSRAGRENWDRLRRLRSTDDPEFVPVFQWGGADDDLKHYLDEAPVVGIGGLVHLMKKKDRPTLEQLGSLCALHPGRFHIFGCDWLRAIMELHRLVNSMDTSKWLDGERFADPNSDATGSKALSQALVNTPGLDLKQARQRIWAARIIEDYVLRRNLQA